MSIENLNLQIATRVHESSIFFIKLFKEVESD